MNTQEEIERQEVRQALGINEKLVDMIKELLLCCSVTDLRELKEFVYNDESR